MNTELEPAFEHDPLTETVIGCVFRVANGLGTGFLEKVYENALVHELRKAGLDAKQQVTVSVHYDGQNVGDYIGDIVVGGASAAGAESLQGPGGRAPRPVSELPQGHRHSHLPGHQLRHHQTTDPAGVTMSHCTHLPLSFISIKCKTNQKKKLFEPPMNTDAHRLKADKEKRFLRNSVFFFIKSLSVFISPPTHALAGILRCVHRWLKVFVFDLLNPNLSVCLFCGSL